MIWTDYFDEIYLVNLPENTERLKSATAELNKYNIPFTTWPAIKKPNGKQGLTLTMKSLFHNALYKNHDRILVFEDDVKFVRDPNETMELCTTQLKNHPYWDMFYLGINMDNPENKFDSFIDKNILKLNFGFSTHAVAYRGIAFKLLLNSLTSNHVIDGNFPLNLAFDVLINKVLPGIFTNRYCAYPLIATQQDGYSDIEGKHSTYEYIQQRFDHSVKHLLKN